MINYLVVIICDYLMIIRFQSQQQVGWFASIPKAFAWNTGTVAHLGDGSLSTGHIAACEQQNLRLIIHNNLASYSGFDPPSTLPRSASTIFLREVVDPAITQIWRYPAPRSRITLAMELCLFTHSFSGMQLSTLMKIITIIAISQFLITWFITF